MNRHSIASQSQPACDSIATVIALDRQLQPATGMTAGFTSVTRDARLEPQYLTSLGHTVKYSKQQHYRKLGLNPVHRATSTRTR